MMKNLLRLAVVATMLAAVTPEGTRAADEDSYLLAHESSKLSRCETRLDRTWRAFKSLENDIDSAKTKLKACRNRLRNTSGSGSGSGSGAAIGGLSSGGASIKPGNVKGAIKKADGYISCATCEGAMKLLPPQPKASDEDFFWLVQLASSQDWVLKRLVGTSGAANVASAMDEVCSDGNFYCQIAFRQDVLEGLLE
ncbi:MAG: hypothetical protein AAF479_06045 [Pseudomonadota bacterium]